MHNVQSKELPNWAYACKNNDHSNMGPIFSVHLETTMARTVGTTIYEYQQAHKELAVEHVKHNVRVTA